MKKKTMKRALLASALSLVLCVSMLVGTTYAWFTDSVASANNKIVSGNLDIELEFWNGTSWVNVSRNSNILTNQLWEPGATEIAYLRVANAGSLALQYQLGINVVSETSGVNVKGEGFKLSDYLQFGVVEGIAVDANDVPATYAAREDAIAALTESKKISAGYSKAASMVSGEELYLALVVYMPASVGNEANHDGMSVPEINLGINVFATQVNHEEDSFGQGYDAGIVIPDAETGVSIIEEDVAVRIPADAFDVYATKPEISEPIIEKIVPENTAGTVQYKVFFEINVDGLKEDNQEPCTVVYYVAPELLAYATDVEVYHNGVKVDNSVFNAETGTVTFSTLSFSPFEIIINTDYVMIPESYTNEEAAAMLKNAAAGAKIDGNGRTIDLGTVEANKWGLSLTKSVSFANMTLKASGKGQVVIIQGKNQTVEMRNVVLQNTNSSGQSLILSLNGATSQIFENCTFKGKAYFQGSNATFVNCSFDKNNNMDSSASNFTFKDCSFTYAWGTCITMNAKAKNILFQECAFSGSGIRIYNGMAQPENVRLIDNTYKTSLVQPDKDMADDYEAWKTNGVWIEEGNVKK